MTEYQIQMLFKSGSVVTLWVEEYSIGPNEAIRIRQHPDEYPRIYTFDVNSIDAVIVLDSRQRAPKTKTEELYATLRQQQERPSDVA